MLGSGHSHSQPFPFKTNCFLVGPRQSIAEGKRNDKNSTKALQLRGVYTCCPSERLFLFFLISVLRFYLKSDSHNGPTREHDDAEISPSPSTKLLCGCSAMKNSARGGSSTGSELKLSRKPALRLLEWSNHAYSESLVVKM
jgi:hypothetical protein